MQTSEYEQRLHLIFEPFLDGPDSKGEFEAFLDHVADPGHKEEIRAFVEGEWKNRSGKKVVEMFGEVKNPYDAPSKGGSNHKRTNVVKRPPYPKKSNRLYRVLVISMLIIALLLFVYWLRSPDMVLP